jgi:hypothetical protein
MRSTNSIAQAAQPNKSVNADAQERRLPSVALSLGAGYVQRYVALASHA